MRTLCLLLLTAALTVAAGCAPSMRQMLIMDTAHYTDCDHVEVECVDEDCSNVAGGPWMATACGTHYRCTRAAGQVTCVPQDS